MHECAGRETVVLSLDSLTWELPETAMQASSLLGHSSSVVGRNKLLVFGGSTGEEATAAVQQLATDNMRWATINTSSASAPQPRLAHAAVALSDKVGCCWVALCTLETETPGEMPQRQDVAMTVLRLVPTV